MRSEVKKYRAFFCALMTIILLTFTGCQVTTKGAWKKLEEFPFQGYDLIASATREINTDDCHSMMIEAVYYTSLSFPEVIQEMEKGLLVSDWDRISENLIPNTLNQHVSYELDNQAFITIYSQVEPISCSEYSFSFR